MKMLYTFRRFLIVLLFLLLSLIVLESTKTLTLKEDHEAMAEAARRTDAAFKAIKAERLSRGHVLSLKDAPNQTGMVGASYTEITTTLGSLESKRSAANPNTAAMVYDMLMQCGVREGDTVAVNLSSSFPALNVAILCALDTCGAKGVIINSVGASTYGANLPDYTYLDMEQTLLAAGLIENHPRWFSLGGADDIGKEMPAAIKEEIVSRLESFGLSFLYYEDIDENIAARRRIYLSGDAPVCFINAGGNLLSFAGGEEMISAKNGLIFPDSPGRLSSARAPEDTAADGRTLGLIPLFERDGVPVIHLLNMKSLLPAWGLPFDPYPMPEPGEGDIYYDWEYSLPLAAGCLILALALLSWAAASLPRKKRPL